MTKPNIEAIKCEIQSYEADREKMSYHTNGGTMCKLLDLCQSLLSIIDSLPSPTLGKMEWSDEIIGKAGIPYDHDWHYRINGIKVGWVHRQNYSHPHKYDGFAQRSHKDDIETLAEAKLWVEQRVASELRSLGTDGRILQALKEGKAEVRLVVGAEAENTLTYNIASEEFEVFNYDGDIENRKSLYSGTDETKALDHLLGETQLTTTNS